MENSQKYAKNNPFRSLNSKTTASNHREISVVSSSKNLVIYEENSIVKQWNQV